MKLKDTSWEMLAALLTLVATSVRAYRKRILVSIESFKMTGWKMEKCYITEMSLAVHFALLCIEGTACGSFTELQGQFGSM